MVRNNRETRRIRSRFVIRVEAVYRKMMLRCLHAPMGLILVTEYPKSGASWLAQMLSATTGIPFPRQEFPPLRKAIYHGHYLGHGVRGPTIVFWRDPRDVMVSWYYHTLFHSNRNHPSFVEMYRRALSFSDRNNITENMPEFIRFNFTRPLSPGFTFNDYFDSWYGVDGIIECRYEDLISAPVDTLHEINRKLGEKTTRSECSAVVERYSFRNLANRNPGQEQKTSYLRKGIVGDWKNHFSEEAKDVFKTFIGERLVRLGYEDSDGW